MQNQSALPFVIESDAISKWLDTLNPTHPVQSSRQIYAVLKELVKSPNKSINALEIILTAITPITIQLSLDLEALFCTSNQSIDAKKRKIARLSINSLRYLALLYGQLSTHNDKSKNISININYCLQICDLYFIQSTLIYERQSTELWKLIGHLYQLALNKNLVNTLINHPLSCLKTKSTINSSIKKILAFNLCHPYQLEQNKIKQLSNFLEQHLKKINVSTTQTENCLHIWDYNTSYGAQACHHQHNNLHLNGLFLDCHQIVPLLLANDFANIAAKITIPQSSILALKQSRPIKKNMAFSFSMVVEIIEQYQQATQTTTPSIHKLSISDKLELQPIEGNQKKIQTITSEDIWQSKKEVSFIETGMIKSSTHLDLILIELQSFSGKANELTVIFEEQRLPQLGIIREIRFINNNKYRYQLIVEKISTTAQAVLIETKKKKKKALICPVKSGTLLIVSPEKFVLEESIQIINKTYQLSRLIENTPSFMMYRIQAK